MNRTPLCLPLTTVLIGGFVWMIFAISTVPVMAQQPNYGDRRIVVPQMPARETHHETASVPNRVRVAKSKSLVQQAAYDEVVDELPPRLVRRRPMVQQTSYGCSCGQCVGEPTCGNEAVFEVGCGAEGCSMVGCDGSCEPACGSEGFFCQEASCGLEPYGAGGCDACGEPSCGGACGTDCYNFCLPILRINWRRFEFFAGVNSFTGPANYANTSAPAANSPASSRVGSSSFGFYEGLNESRDLKRLFGLDLSAQLGVRATQTGLSGAEFTRDTRNQVFVTGGFFRRVDFGLQYGLVVDYLNDDWYFHNDLVQLRGELSWNDGCSHEFGYQFMAGVQDSTSATSVINAAGTTFRGSVTFEPTDQHRIFFRGSNAGGGQYYAFVGATNHNDGLLGAGMSSAARRGFAFQAGTAYLIPNQGRRDNGNEEESWNMSMGIVYRPGGRVTCGRYCRPMFDVADNGTFMVDRL